MSPPGIVGLPMLPNKTPMFILQWASFKWFYVVLYVFVVDTPTMHQYNVSDSDKITDGPGSSIMEEAATPTADPEECSEACEANTDCFAAYFEHNTQLPASRAVCFLYASEAELDAEVESDDTRTHMIKKKFTKTVTTEPCKC